MIARIVHKSHKRVRKIAFERLINIIKFETDLKTDKTR